MVNEDEKLIRLKQQRSKEAIDLAMQGKWQEAIAVNKEIIESFPTDVDAFNRLGRAYMEMGDYTKAKVAYSHSLELDPYNAIAKRNAQRLGYLKQAVSPEAQPHKVEPQHFIEEIGKAGVVNLYELAPKEVLAKMVAGDTVYLKINGPRRLAAENGRNEYLGQVDSKHTQRLIKLMEGGNRYSAAVVSSNDEVMTIIIREVYQNPSQAGRLSFPPRELEEVRPYPSDRVFKAESEEEAEEPGYTVIGGEEIEVLPEEPDHGDEDIAGEDV